MNLFSTDADEALDRLTRLACTTLGSAVALVTLADQTRQYFKSQFGLPEPWDTLKETPLAHSICQHVVESGEPLIVSDAREHPLLSGNLAVSILGVIAYAGIPIQLEDGKVLGAFCTIDYSSRVWTDAEVGILSDLAAAAASEIRWRAAGEAGVRFQALTESASDGILTIGADSVIVSANSAAERIFGYTASELVGQPLSILIPERLRGAHACGVARYLETGKRHLRWNGEELPGLTRAGEEIPLEISFAEYIHMEERVFTGFIRDISERKRLQQERKFIERANRTLASSLDYEATLSNAARLAVSQIADWCAVDLLQGGKVQRVAVAHADPTQSATARALHHYALGPDATDASAHVIRTGKPVLYPEISVAFVDAVASDPAHQRPRETHGIGSALVIPLIAQGRTLGAISLVCAESGRRYGPQDLALAEELAEWAAIAVDRARLLRRAKDSRDALEYLTSQMDLQMEEIHNQATQLEEKQSELKMANEELERANAELRAAEAHYRRLVETSPNGVFVLDASGRFTEINPAGERILGRAADDILDRDFQDVIAPHSLELAREAFSQVISGVEPSREVELWIHRPAEDRRFLNVVITAIRAGVESIGIHGVSRDITEERRVQESLRQSETRHRTLLRAIPDLIIRQTRAGELLDVRAPEVTHGLNVVPAQIRGQNLRDLLPAALVEVILAHTDVALQTGEVQSLAYELPIVDEQQSFEARLVPNGPDEVLMLVRNVTDQKRLGVRENELAREHMMRAEAEAANQAKNDFLSRMSHELRTPLNAILGFGQLLDMEVKKPENKESVEQILNAGRHVLALVNEVLDIARIEAGQMSLPVEPVSVQDVVRESLDLVRPMAVAGGITLMAHDALETEHFVQADQQRLKQVLLNLLSNAIKYNRPEGTVTVSCEDIEERLRITVQDAGLGIPAEKIGRLFTAFDRLDADETAVQGTGLGLALSKGLVEAMGGQLGVSSVEGEGSRFWVELPRVT